MEKSARKRQNDISNSIYVSAIVCNPLEDERLVAEKSDGNGGRKKKKREKRREGRRRLGRYTIWVSASVVGNDAGRRRGSVTWRRNCYAMAAPIKDNSHLPFRFHHFLSNNPVIANYTYFLIA